MFLRRHYSAFMGIACVVVVLGFTAATLAAATIKELEAKRSAEDDDA